MNRDQTTARRSGLRSPRDRVRTALRLRARAAAMPRVRIEGTPPDGLVGELYKSKLIVTGGTPSYQWTTVEGVLPYGLSLDQTGTILGKPEKNGPSQFALQVTDASGRKSDPHHISLTIYPKFKITSDLSRRSDLPVPGKGFIADLHAEGGAPDYTWTLPPGSAAPAWLNVAANGRITGTPDSTGTRQFTVQAVDGAGRTATADFSVNVRPRRLWRHPPKMTAWSITVRTSWRETLSHVSAWLALLAVGIPTLGTIGILVYAFSTPGSHLTYWGVGMMTGLAAFLTGCLAGFLFGIPRAVSTGAIRQRTGTTEYSPSSNLAEVSDWLTKLLLGAGLVQLTHLGAPIASLIDHVAGGLHGPAGPSQAATVMAGAILFGYTAIGLLNSYVITTMWYQDRLIKHSVQS